MKCLAKWISIWLLFLSLPVMADTEFFTGFTLVGGLANNFSGGLGCRVTIQTDNITITKLGRRCQTGDSHTHVITLYAGDDTVLGSVTVDMAGHSSGDIVEATLSSPVQVLNGFHYFIQTTETSGGDSWGFWTTTHTTDATDDGSASETGGHNTYNNDGSDNTYGPATFSYTSGGGGGCTGCAPTNVVRLDNEFFSGNTLPMTLGWSNTDNTLSIGVDYMTNNGDAFIRFETKNPNTTNSSAIHILQNQVWSFRLTYDGTHFSETNSYWGEQKITLFTFQPTATNQALFTFKNVASDEGNGVLIKQATNPSFIGNLMWITVPKTNGQLYNFTYNFQFLFNQGYYFQAFATNVAGYQTGPSDTVSGSPNALPNPADYFNAFNHQTVVGRVHTIWTDLRNSLINEWILEASVGDSNSFAKIFQTPAGNFTTEYDDDSQTPGTVVYYRVRGTNIIGTTYSQIVKVAVAVNVAGSPRFIDVQATGNNDGSSWSNAYPNFGSINQANIQPGTLLWIAPGTYQDGFVVFTGGTNGSPVTYKLATTNAPHGAGKATIPFILNQVAPYVYFDGPLDDSWDHRTWTVDRLETDGMTNNIGIVLLGRTNVGRALNTISTGCHYRWLSPTGPYFSSLDFGEGSVAAFHTSSGTGGDFLFEFCWAHDMTNDARNGSEGFSGNPSSSSGFNGTIIRYCIIERMKDNAIGGGGSMTIHDNIIREWIPPGPAAGHPDGIQLGAQNLLIYNNIISNYNGTCMYYELVTTNTTDLYDYNNRYYGKTSDGSLPHDGVIFSTEHNVQGLIIDTMTVSNVLIANNTFYGFSGGYLTGTLRQNQANNLWFTNITVAGNMSVALTFNTGLGFGYGIDDAGGNHIGNGTNFGPGSVNFNYNNLCGADTNIGWVLASYSVGAFGTLTGFTNNQDYHAQFVDTNAANMHLTIQDSTNLISTNLSVFESVAPGISRTADGYLRAKLGWQQGALGKVINYNLVSWPTFEVYNSANNAPDATPFLNDAVAGQGFASTNYPIATNCPGGFAGAFFGNNQYLCITNCNQLTNLTQLSISLRGAIGGGPLGDAVFLDAGSLATATNGWAFGRDDTTPLRFWVIRDDGVKTNLCPFNDSIGTPLPFACYGVTMSCSGSSLTGVGYTNGVPFITNIIDHVSHLTVAEAYQWIAVGKRKHNHDTNPNVSPDTPNGFIVAPMADVQLFRTALTDTEMLDVFLGQSSGGSGGSAPIIGSFTATPSTIMSGQSSTLAWAVTGADTLSIDNGVGDVTGLTQIDVSPTTTTTYTLTATNSSGSSQSQVTVTIQNSTLPAGVHLRIKRRLP